MTLNKELLIGDVKKSIYLILSFAIYAYGVIQVKALDLGMAPWETFALGVNNKTGIDFGKVTQGVGFIIIIISIFIKIYPGIGTILNMIFIGFFADLISKFNIVLMPQNYLLKILILFYGIIIMNIGVYNYLRFEIGAGPRDGLMLGLVKITDLDVKYIKTAIEVLVLLIGYLLGGRVGVGTLISAFSGGYVLNKIFKWKNFDSKKTKQRKLTDYLVSDNKEIAIKNSDAK